MEGWQSGSIASVLKTEGCKSSVSSNLTPSSHYALVAQRLAQDAYTIEVTGSNPVGSTKDLVAQLVNLFFNFLMFLSST